MFERISLLFGTLAIAPTGSPSIKIILNPVKSGYCPIKRLVLTQCQLGIDGTRTVFTSLRDNVFVEELIMNGNHCTDTVMGDIVATLKASANKFKLLRIKLNFSFVS